MNYILDKINKTTWLVEDEQALMYASIKDLGYMFKITTEDNVKATFATIDACMQWFMRDGDDYTIAIGKYE